MSRLDEVRKEIEQLCEEIEQDALRSRQSPSAGDKATAAPPVCIDVILSRDVPCVRLNIALQQTEDNERH
ncbi:hypothetical protein [Caballeronia sp. LZ001]|uniref:hypothetical protein n=1 Tax=Caballeronia sp. LZ001 TaxID=3038553 RepID=UPI0028574C64|nr:hypothetical protein [Caballeronia sp. LZ001]MDR5804894.1 hypothetical protein [Caballeronia sp. LZ001]